MLVDAFAARPPRTATRWFWFWLTVGCAPLAYAAYAVTELLGVGATPARRRTGGLGFVIGCLLAIGLAVSADTLRSTFGVHLPL